MPRINLREEWDKGRSSKYYHQWVNFGLEDSLSFSEVVRAPYAEARPHSQSADPLNNTVYKNGDFCLGDPGKWEASWKTTAPDPCEFYYNLPYGSNRFCGAFGLLGIDLGLDPMTEQVKVELHVYEGSWSDYWTQSGPFLGLDTTGTHKTDMGWGYVRDQSVSQLYMLEVFDLPIHQWLDATEYVTSYNIGMGNAPSGAGGTPGEPHVMTMETDGNGAVYNTWQYMDSGVVDPWDGTAYTSPHDLPTAYQTGATGVYGFGLIEIQTHPGYRGTNLNFASPDFLLFGRGDPAFGVEYPGITASCWIEW